MITLVTVLSVFCLQFNEIQGYYSFACFAHYVAWPWKQRVALEGVYVSTTSRLYATPRSVGNRDKVLAAGQTPGLHCYLKTKLNIIWQGLICQDHSQIFCSNILQCNINAIYAAPSSNPVNDSYLSQKAGWCWSLTRKTIAKLILIKIDR